MSTEPKDVANREAIAQAVRVIRDQTGVDDDEVALRALEAAGGYVVDAIAGLLYKGRERQLRPVRAPKVDFETLSDVEKLRLIMCEKEQMFHAMVVATKEGDERGGEGAGEGADQQK